MVVDGSLPHGRQLGSKRRVSRLANLGLGHGAIDFGAGYTYFNPQTGNEFSAVAGATYNFKNTSSQYQNGIVYHFTAKWGLR